MTPHAIPKAAAGAQKIRPLDWITISPASPESIRKNSRGEVRTDKTLRDISRKQSGQLRQRPFEHGLFCERIFGPVEDYKCACGKYNATKNPANRGKICEKCGVKVALAAVRRERAGHIELAAPVCHIWYLRDAASSLGLLLGLSLKDLVSVIYYKGYLVTNPGRPELKLKLFQVLPIDKEAGEGSYEKAQQDHPDAFEAEIGAEVIQKLLKNLDVPGKIAELELAIAATRDKSQRSKLVRRLRLLQAWQAEKILPEWLVLSVLPVLPAGLRPLLPLSSPKDGFLESIPRRPEIENEYARLGREFRKYYPKIETTYILVDDPGKLASLARQLKHPRRPVDQFLNSNLAETTQALLENYSGEGVASEPLRTALLRDLNDLIDGDLIFESQRFAGVRLRPITRSLRDLSLLDSRPRLDCEARLRFNRMLLEDAFPSELTGNLRNIKSSMGVVIDDLNELYSRVIRQNNRLNSCLGKKLEGINILDEKRKLQEAVDALLASQPDEATSCKRTVERLQSLTEMIQTIKGETEQDVRQLNKLIAELRKLRQAGGLFSTENHTQFQVLDAGFQKKEITLPDAKIGLEKLVDALINQTAQEPDDCKAKKNPLRSLSSRLSGKGGLFRQNLLGKRVDYSGRSVIVVDPQLKLHQCGLPKELAVAIFEPFVIRKLMDSGNSKKAAENLFESRTGEVWDKLAEVIKDHPVFLNRAPSLHRLSIQAFEPQLIQGEEIRLHPLVCAGFGADFDGDTMAVHLPLSVEAQMEARLLMMATPNFLNPANGLPAMNPSQDMVLGCYYLTAEPRQPLPPDLKTLPLFGSKTEALALFYHQSIQLRDWAMKTHDWIRLVNPDFGRATPYGDAGEKDIKTTIGRILFNDIWPEELGFYNRPTDKKKISEMILQCYRTYGPDRAVALLDQLKEVGFEAATRAGISIGIDDFIIPREILNNEIPPAKAKTDEVNTQYQKRLSAIESKTSNPQIRHEKTRIAAQKYFTKLKSVWYPCNDEVEKKMMPLLKANQGRNEFNPVWLMVESGARGNKEQVRQLVGLRGLMAKPGGGFAKRPVLTNFRDGLSIADYFISCHGVRKGVSDRSRRTADAGYLTRKLVSAAQDIVVREADCGTRDGIWVHAIMVDDEKGERKEPVKKTIVSLVERIAGRVTAAAVKDNSGKVLIAAGEMITREVAATINAAGVEKVKIRSPITCESRLGICVNCYGHSLTSGDNVKLGEAVGVIAAQSIGEPGTQLTMRTFHTGGTASQNDITGGIQRVTELLEARRPKSAAVMAELEGTVTAITLESCKTKGADKTLMTQCVIIRETVSGREEQHHIPAGKLSNVKVGDRITKGQALTDGTFDPREIFEVCDLQKLQDYLITEVQKVYCPQVTINCTHIEVIIRQMLTKVCVTEPGDTCFNQGEEVGKIEFEEENERIEGKGGQIAEADPILLGITQAALRSDSFLSAASFQRTSQILAEAAMLAKSDELSGFKECVMTGKLIPAGTGFEFYQETEVMGLG